jgi:outer membrane immunogenic protein
VKGGGAWEHDSYDLKFAATGATLSTARETRGGYSIGGGVEYAITNCVSAFAEYDYYGFGTRTDTFFIPPAIGVTDLYSIKESKSVLEGGLNLRWGPSGCGWTPTPAAAPIVTKR